MTRSERRWFWGEVIALMVGLLLIASWWVLHDVRWVWAGVFVGATTFIVTTVHGPVIWR